VNGIEQRMQELKDQAGGILLEVLVAIFLFGVAMMGLAQLGYASILGNKSSQSMMDATILCQDRLEQAKQLGYAKVDSLHLVDEAYATIPDNPLFRRRTEVTPDATSGTKRVKVTVYWLQNKHSFVLETQLSER